MFYRGKVIVNGGVDIELPRLKRSERNEKHLFMPGTQMQTIINDCGTENNWQLILKDTRTEKESVVVSTNVSYWEEGLPEKTKDLFQSHIKHNGRTGTLYYIGSRSDCLYRRLQFS